jgi:hypothetical protein
LGSRSHLINSYDHLLKSKRLFGKSGETVAGATDLTTPNTIVAAELAILLASRVKMLERLAFGVKAALRIRQSSEAITALSMATPLNRGSEA